MAYDVLVRVYLILPEEKMARSQTKNLNICLELISSFVALFHYSTFQLSTMEDLSSLIDWSRAQFAMTAIYHWLFVPLTLGLAVIVGVMETIYYRTRSQRWLAVTKFWMTLFGINFAMGVATGIILEFEIGRAHV